MGKTTRSFTCDPHTEEVMNRFKGLDLVGRVPEELWTEVNNIVQEAVTKIIQKKKKYKKVLPSEQCKEIEENNRRGKPKDLFKEIRDSKGTFHAKMGQ